MCAVWLYLTSPLLFLPAIMWYCVSSIWYLELSPYLGRNIIRGTQGPSAYARWQSSNLVLGLRSEQLPLWHMSAAPNHGNFAIVSRRHHCYHDHSLELPIDAELCCFAISLSHWLHSCHFVVVSRSPLVVPSSTHHSHGTEWDRAISQ